MARHAGGGGRGDDDPSLAIVRLRRLHHRVRHLDREKRHHRVRVDVRAVSTRQREHRRPRA